MPLVTATYLLSGCGGTDDSGPTAEEAKTPTASEAGTMTLKDTSAEDESSLTADMRPKPAALERFAEQLKDLNELSDLEAQDALSVLITPTVMYTDHADAEDSELANANLAWLVGIDEFAERCKAAGSSALQ